MMKLSTLSWFALLFSCASAEVRAPSSAPQDHPATHGMLLFGTERTYASHLPMFHRPHDYQGIFRIELGDEGMAAYQNSQRSFPQETVYTLVPQPFSLPQMAENPTPFRAQLFRGHFERGGTLIASDVAVNIREVLFFQKFDPRAQRPAAPSYLLFGSEKEQFAAHLISLAPDFDQIVRLSAGEAGAMLAQRSVLRATLPPDPAEKPLGSRRELVFNLPEEGSTLNAVVLQSLYLEFGDLSQ